MKRVVCMLVMMLMAATFGMEKKAKIYDAAIRTIIQKATAKAAMEALEEEGKWEEFLGLAQLDPSLIDESLATEAVRHDICYRDDTKTFLVVSEYFEYKSDGAGGYYKADAGSSYWFFDPWNQISYEMNTSEASAMMSKSKWLHEFKSPIPVAERKAKLERMKLEMELELMNHLKKFNVAKFERAHNEMMIYLAMVGSGKASIEMTKKFVKEAFNYEDSSLPWTYVLYHPQRRILKIQRLGDTYWKTFFLEADGRIRKNFTQPTNCGEMGKQIEGIMDLERDGFRVVFYSGSFNWEKLNPITNAIDNLKEVSTGGLPLYKNN